MVGGKGKSASGLGNRRGTRDRSKPIGVFTKSTIITIITKNYGKLVPTVPFQVHTNNKCESEVMVIEVYPGISICAYKCINAIDKTALC